MRASAEWHLFSFVSVCWSALFCCGQLVADVQETTTYSFTLFAKQTVTGQSQVDGGAACCSIIVYPKYTVPCITDGQGGDPTWTAGSLTPQSYDVSATGGAEGPGDRVEPLTLTVTADPTGTTTTPIPLPPNLAFTPTSDSSGTLGELVIASAAIGTYTYTLSATDRLGHTAVTTGCHFIVKPPPIHGCTYSMGASTCFTHARTLAGSVGCGWRPAAACMDQRSRAGRGRTRAPAPALLPLVAGWPRGRSATLS